MSGSRQMISINSEPQGASVSSFTRYGQIHGCNTPCIVSMSERTSVLSFQMDGFSDETINLKAMRTIQPWFLGNLLFGGLIRIIGDVSTSAHLRLPNVVAVEMKEIKT